MKNYVSLTLLLALGVLAGQGCDLCGDDNNDTCNTIFLDTPFTARVGEEWCIPSTGWQMELGMILEDSRCNIPDIECVWAGRFVMAVRFENGNPGQDTFMAVHNWQDTLYNGPYTIVLEKIYPEIRNSWESTDPGEYSFEIIVK